MARKRTDEGNRDEVPVSEAAQRLGESIKARRLERGLTVYALAKATGLSQEGLRKIELGLREPNWRTMVQVAGALSLSLDELAAAVRLHEPIAAQEPSAPKPGRPRKAPPAGEAQGETATPAAKKGKGGRGK